MLPCRRSVVCALILVTATACALSARPAKLRTGQLHTPCRSSTRCWPVATADAESQRDDDATKAESAAPPNPPSGAPKLDDGDDDLLSSVAFLKQKLKVLQKELVEVSAQTKQVREQYEETSAEYSQQRSRLQSDFDNYRARHFNQTIDAQIDARIKVLKDFLGVVDNFDRARASIKADTEAAAAVNAKYLAMNEMLMTVLASLEVTKVETVGKEFDYNLHMAIQQVPSPEYEEGIVCSELQPGFLCKSKLIRPAYVIVSG